MNDIGSWTNGDSCPFELKGGNRETGMKSCTLRIARFPSSFASCDRFVLLLELVDASVNPSEITSSFEGLHLVKSRDGRSHRLSDSEPGARLRFSRGEGWIC